MLKNFGPGDRFPEYVSVDAFIILFCLFLLASMNGIYILICLLFSNIFLIKVEKTYLKIPLKMDENSDLHVINSCCCF